MHGNLENSSRPFGIGDGASDAGPRLGGRAPLGIQPRNAELRYFFTIPFGQGMELSLFISPDPDFVFSAAARSLQPTAKIEVVVHAPTTRASGPYDAAISEHPIVLLDPIEDVQEEDGEVRPYSGHKLGGRPYLVNQGGRLEEALEELIEFGFVQTIQIDFPGGEHDTGTVEGPWPTGGALFHLLTRGSDEGVEWRCFWEQ